MTAIVDALLRYVRHSCVRLQLPAIQLAHIIEAYVYMFSIQNTHTHTYLILAAREGC